MKKLAVLLVASVVSVEANAWGSTEQDVLKGIVGGLIVKEVYEIHKDRRRGYPVYSSVYHGSESQFYCQDEDEVVCAYKRGQWERQQQEHAERVRRAYECGRSGAEEC